MLNYHTKEAIMAKLNGKVAFVTGGNSGMGLESARLLAAEGARVIITGRRAKEVDEAAKYIGPNGRGIVSDVSKLADLDALYATIKKDYGHLDIIFANAGVGEFAGVADADEAHFDRIFDINVKGLFFTVQKALPILRDGASIILNASSAASTGMENFSVYSASKAAVRSFARTLTLDLKARGIRVNAISPGPIDTPIFGKIEGLTDEQIAGFKTGIATMVPLGRMGRSEEIAKAVLFLASDDSSFTTGAELPVDGGMAQV